jgi:hypothetical protein
MRIFIQDHDSSPQETVRQALDIFYKAGIYSAGGGIIGDTIHDRGVIIVDAGSVPEVVAALNKAGMRAAIG